MILFCAPSQLPSRFKVIFLAPLILFSVAGLLLWWGLSR